KANDDVVQVIANRQTVNDSSGYPIVVQELSALLLAAISSVIETIGVRAPDHDGLTCGVDRFTGSDNDFIGDETLLFGCTNGLIAGEKDFTGDETVRADSENCVTAGENDITDGEIGSASGEK